MQKQLNPFNIELGANVRDKVTGIAGIVIGRTEWLTGCRTYGVQPTKLKDGMAYDPVWHDETRLEVLKKGRVVTPVYTGGPAPTPKRETAPGTATPTPR